MYNSKISYIFALRLLIAFDAKLDFCFLWNFER